MHTWERLASRNKGLASQIGAASLVAQRLQGALSCTLTMGFRSIWCDLGHHHFSEGSRLDFLLVQWNAVKLNENKDPPNLLSNIISSSNLLWTSFWDVNYVELEYVNEAKRSTLQRILRLGSFLWMNIIELEMNWFETRILRILCLKHSLWLCKAGEYSSNPGEYA
jgi:hypothetical protein